MFRALPIQIALASFGLATVVHASHAQEPIGLQLYVGYGAPEEYETVFAGQTEPLWIETARPAYVAIFEITPRGDLQLLRPYYLDEVVRTGRGTQFMAVGDPFRPYWGPAGLGVGYLFAVASDEPIRVPRSLSGIGSFFRTSGSFNYRMLNVGFRGWDVIDEVAAAVGASEVAVVEYLSFPTTVRYASLRLPSFFSGPVAITRVASAEPLDGTPPPSSSEPAPRERWRARNGDPLQDTDGITVVAYDGSSWTRLGRWEDTSWRDGVWNHRRRWSSETGLTSTSSSPSWRLGATSDASSSRSTTSWRGRGSSADASGSSPSDTSPDTKRSWRQR